MRYRCGMPLISYDQMKRGCKEKFSTPELQFPACCSKSISCPGVQ